MKSLSLSKGEIKRQKILGAVVSFVQTNEGSPTVQNIMEITGIRSFNTVSRHLKTLQQEGFLEWEPGANGRITVLDNIQ
ncbi:hypothetical protein [Ammoniphilus sp. CFH 90114]|uniref:LexA family protein n=1 Tax=Ammoniphilus sp. CFH 90114 TaxID=2493665 RepID=UPI00100E3885|nr:hypothetical protein [Ammoniphilus sp. CFH 90114]RXT09099.1 hypothetical protein EIZ39_10030 [Ammoniphilus sp. CFH 90114]